MFLVSEGKVLTVAVWSGGRRDGLPGPPGELYGLKSGVG